MPHDRGARRREIRLGERDRRARCEEDLRAVRRPGQRDKTGRDEMKTHQIASRDEWLAARVKLLAREKELTRQRDELARQRRELPWVKVEKRYEFDGPDGRLTLSDLFGTRSQLVVYHFMFGPDWQEGCPSCSFVSDHIDGARVHLAARDVSLVMVSRAPFAKIAAFKKRMGWRFDWVSSHGSEFNRDFHVAFTPDELAEGAVDYNYVRAPFPSQEAPGLSVFSRDGASVFHTYSTYARGLDPLVVTYTILDLVPKGRDEDQLGFSMEWVRHHDRYESGVLADPDRPYWPTET
jgi:predicted dithiol-disulfide oxidoreductase (DUF899 family)